MNEQYFNVVFKKLAPRQKEVLLQFLKGNKDQEIANSLCIQKSTVRKHLEKVCKAFNFKNEFSDERSSHRMELIALFAKYKPELLEENLTEVEEEWLS